MGKKEKEEKTQEKKKIYVDEMVLSADTADDLEDWLSDIKETTRICRKIVKYVDAIYEKEVESREEEDNIKWLENQTELQYKKIIIIVVMMRMHRKLKVVIYKASSIKNMI